MVLSDVWREAGRPRSGRRLAEESESSYELGSAVTGVEQRGTGRWMYAAGADGSKPRVSALRANRAGDAQGQRVWEEPSVRAKSMLTGPEVGVEGRQRSLLAVRGLFSYFTAYG